MIFRKTIFRFLNSSKEMTKNIFIFQVLVPAAGIRGFLDASEYGTWLKHFQSVSQTDDDTKQNVKHFLLAGQVNK